jgi:holo-[acyl-carrier protein] synthase
MIEIGIDIQEINQFLERNKKMVEKIFSFREVEYCESKHAPAQHYAVRFAAKEAVIKALSGFGEKLNYGDIEILIKDKKPYIKVNKALRKKYKYSVSLSHSGDYAIANVIVQNGCTK